ncbi:MAG: dodecin family protein [Caldilineaceae bacterium]
MSESVYKVIQLVGTSEESWERAAAVAIEAASKTLHDLRIAEVIEQDVTVENGKPHLYRVKLKLSFRYHHDDKD